MMIKKQIYITSALLFIVIIFFGINDFDIKVQNYLFDFNSNTWILDKDLEPYKFFFYDGIKKILIIFALLLLIAILFFRKTILVQKYKKGIMIVILSSILVPLIVGGLKRETNMPCPKNELLYGGKLIRTAVWESYPLPYENMPHIKCWPAGHASGGFALLSLFFLFKKQKNRFIALGIAFTIGWSMGIYKMFIGDHFLSHTLITMLLAWLIILFITLFITKGKLDEKSTTI